MKTAVVMRQVPDLIEPLELADSHTALDLDGASFVVNESDAHALEQALLLKERGDGSVTVLALDYGDVDNTLYTAAAKGADRIIKLAFDAETPPVPRAAAKLYAAAIEPLQPEMVLVGVQAYDELEGVLAPLLALELNFPYLGVVRGVQAMDGGGLQACKEFPGAVMGRFDIRLPAVLGILTADQPPRYVPVTRIRAAMKSTQFEEQLTATAPTAPGISIGRLYAPQVGERAEMLAGSEEEVAARVVEILVEKGLVK